MSQNSLLKKSIQKQKNRGFTANIDKLKSDDQIELSFHKNYNIAIEELRDHIQVDDSLKTFILKSLKLARQNAQNLLQENLFNVLEWPENIEEYLDFLQKFSRWTPVQSGGAWVVHGKYDQSKEVYDRLCHFHFLIGQDLEQEGSIKISQKFLYNFQWFSDWLVRYTKQWGSYLDTEESFNEETMRSFMGPLSSDYHVRDSMVYDYQKQKYVPNEPSGWKSFNQFFARKLNSGLRQIQKPYSNLVVTSPADCTFKEMFQIQEDSTIQQIVVKKTHSYASIHELLDGSEYMDEFQGGQFIHYFLGPNDYHRFHAPIAGKVLECRNVQGKAMLAVNLKDKQFDAPDDAKDAYEFFQSRGILVIDTQGSEYGDVGKVAIIPVGMCQVSSVMMTAQQGQSLLKGEEFGYFQFGGSDIIMLFQKGVNVQLFKEEKHYNYGEQVGEVVQQQN